MRNNIHIIHLCFALVVFLSSSSVFPWMIPQVKQQKSLWKIFGHLLTFFCLLLVSLAVCLRPFDFSSSHGSPAPQRDWFVASCCSAMEEMLILSYHYLSLLFVVPVGSLCQCMWASRQNNSTVWMGREGIFLV